MSVGRPDPNYIPKFVSPEEYNRNKASIEAARAKLEEYARMNEVAKRNFELKEQEEREERELAQKIQEGELAKQRLLQLRKRRSLAITDGGSSSIENVGDGYGGEITSLHQNFAPYPQSMSQPMRQTASYDVSPSYNHPGHIQQPQLYGAPQSYSGSSQINSSRVPQNQYSTLPPSYPTYQGARHNQSSNSGQSFSGQQPSNPPQHQTHQTTAQNSRSVYPHPHQVTNPSSSSLVGALGPNPSRTSSSWDAGQTSLPSPLWDISMPASPSVAQLQSIKHYLNVWASSVPPQTHYGATILWDTYVVKCFKNQEGIIVFSIETPNGTIEAAAHGILDDLMAKVKQPQIVVNPSAQMPTTMGQTIHDTCHSSSRTSNSSSHVPSTTPSLATQNRSLTAQNMVVDQTNVAPVSQAPTTTVPISQTSQQRANHVNVLSSAKSITPNTQVSQSPVPPLSTVSHATTGNTAISSASAPPQGPLTPSKQSTSEQMILSITPQQADKKRIAQSLLWALGKRPRESPSDTESQSSKKRAIETSEIENSHDGAQNTTSASRINTQLDSVPPSHPIDRAGPSNVTQHSNQPSDANVLSTTHSVDIASTVISQPSITGAVANLPPQANRPTDLRPSESNTRPLPNTAMTNPEYYPRADYDGFRRKLGEVGPSSQVSSARVQSATHDESEKSVRDKQSEPSSHLQSMASAQLATTSTTQLPVSAPLSTSSYTPVTLSHPQTAVLISESKSKEPQQSRATSSSQKAAEKVGSDSSNILVETEPPSTSARAVRYDQESGPSASINALAPPKSTTPPQYSAVKQADREPLFLPSSSPESGPSFSGRQSETPVATVRNAKKVVKRIEHRAYVMVPPAPDYLVRYREQLRRKQVRGIQDQEEEQQISIPETPVEEEDFWYTFESQRGSPSDENEREAIRLACSRLQPSRCKWDGCDAIMNSGGALIRHLNMHKPEPNQNIRTFMCRWTQCGQQGVRFEDSQHLKKHALLPLRCAYKDCKESFRSGGQLLKHFRKRHVDGILKPSAKPEPPITEVTAELPKIPDPFPSYLLSTDLACGEVLSQERHRLVGQQVLMNITFVDDGAPLKRRPKKTARPASRALPDPTAHLTSDYQFLVTKDTARSSTYSSMACDIDHEDLDSAQVSRIVKEGLVLWGSDEEETDGGAAVAVAPPPDLPQFSPEPQQQLLDAVTMPGGETGTTPGYDRSASVDRKTRFDEFHTSDVEDAAVENMLTDVDIDLTLTS